VLFASVLLAGLGVAMAIASLRVLSHMPSSAHGFAVLGAASALLGFVGCVTAGVPLPCALDAIHDNLGVSGPPALRTRTRRAALPLRTALLVALPLAALGTLACMDHMSSSLGVSCTMAEAAIRIAHLEETVTQLRHEELLTQVQARADAGIRLGMDTISTSCWERWAQHMCTPQVFSRLNEMDDLLDATATGSLAHVDLRLQALHQHNQDRQVVRERVERLHRHANTLLADMRQQLAATNAALAQSTVQLDLPPNAQPDLHTIIGPQALPPTLAAAMAAGGSSSSSSSSSSGVNQRASLAHQQLLRDREQRRQQVSHWGAVIEAQLRHTWS
jgi:hypothetical protein